MLSGNGRHRRPRQAPAIFVTAGVTGASIAIPLLGASGAQAADAETWDRVAQCESGGMWSADTGNGFYGGLQFTQDTWEEHGGLDYAPTADRASRSQQIAVAEKVLEAEGPMAWPACAVNAGLSEEDDAKPEVDPGGTESAFPEEPEGSGAGTELIEGDRKSVDVGSGEKSSGGETEDASVAEDASGEESEESVGSGARDKSGGGAESGGASGSGGSPSGEDSRSGDSSRPGDAAADDGAADGDVPGGGAADGSEGTGKHRGVPAEKDAEDRGTGRHASRGGAADRDGAAADRDKGKDEDGYTVQPGDSLSGIADAHELEGGWPALYGANESVVGDDPDLILPGQQLDLIVSEQ